MKRFKSAALVVLVAGSAVAIATQVTAAPETTDTKVTVTGCVAKAEGAGQFILTSAAPVPEPAAPVATGTTGAPTLDRPAAMEHQLSYALTGKSLEGHLGHKVEVTGTTPAIAVAADKTTEASPATPATGTTAGSASAPLAVLDVTTVKMIAATCS